MGEHTDKTKGKIKQALGKVIGNEKLQREGKRDEAKGRAVGAANDLKDRTKKAREVYKVGHQVAQFGGETGETIMSTGTIVIVIILALILFGGGGGYYWSRRRR